MRSPEYVLSSLRQHSKDQTYRYERIYRLLYNSSLYEAAYQNIYAKPGNMTQGVDEVTADGMTLRRIDRLIDALRDESYQPKPARRIYIPKKNGKLRPLGIQSFDDKLVQEVIRMILESIYEDDFEDCSCGFRPGRSCHTALMQIQRCFTGSRWFIEGDIQGFFDNIDHQVLIRIMEKRIHDDRFLRLIRKFLNAGYMEARQLHATYSGTAQGGIISPILANIYLNELDKRVMSMAARFCQGKCRKTLPSAKAIQFQIAKRRKKMANADSETRKQLRKEITALEQQRIHLPATDPMHPNYRRLHYVRYADDWLIGVIGSKADCVQIKQEIGQFLKDELHLTLSDEKTLITNAQIIALAIFIKVVGLMLIDTLFVYEIPHRLSAGCVGTNLFILHIIDVLILVVLMIGWIAVNRNKLCIRMRTALRVLTLRAVQILIQRVVLIIFSYLIFFEDFFAVQTYHIVDQNHMVLIVIQAGTCLAAFHIGSVAMLALKHIKVLNVIASDIAVSIYSSDPYLITVSTNDIVAIDGKVGFGGGFAFINVVTARFVQNGVFVMICISNLIPRNFYTVRSCCRRDIQNKLLVHLTGSCIEFRLRTIQNIARSIAGTNPHAILMLVDHQSGRNCKTGAVGRHTRNLSARTIRQIVNAVFIVVEFSGIVVPENPQILSFVSRTININSAHGSWNGSSQRKCAKKHHFSLKERLVILAAIIGSRLSRRLCCRLSGRFCRRLSG